MPGCIHLASFERHGNSERGVVNPRNAARQRCGWRFARGAPGCSRYLRRVMKLAARACSESPCRLQNGLFGGICGVANARNIDRYCEHLRLATHSKRPFSARQDFPKRPEAQRGFIAWAMRWPREATTPWGLRASEQATVQPWHDTIPRSSHKSGGHVLPGPAARAGPPPWRDHRVAEPPAWRGNPPRRRGAPGNVPSSRPTPHQTRCR